MSNAQSTQKRVECIEQIWHALLNATEPVVLTSHVNIDGDGLGAMLALANLLGREDRTTELILDSRIPQVFTFLTGSERIRPPQTDRLPDACTLVALDCATQRRLGDCTPLAERAELLVNVDHHQSNERYGDLHWIEPDVSSTSEMILDFATQLGLDICPGTAEAVYVGIITDTGRFCHSNTTPSCLHAAARLVQMGVDPGRMGERLYKNVQWGILQLRTLALNTVRLALDQRVATMEIHDEMFGRTGTDPIDTQEFVDIPASIEGVEVAVLLRDVPGTNDTKVSLRSKGEVDVSAVAQQFGGGGHRNAAGCEIPAPIPEARRRVIAALDESLDPSETPT